MGRGKMHTSMQKASSWRRVMDPRDINLAGKNSAWLLRWQEKLLELALRGKQLYLKVQHISTECLCNNKQELQNLSFAWPQF